MSQSLLHLNKWRYRTCAGKIRIILRLTKQHWRIARAIKLRVAMEFPKEILPSVCIEGNASGLCQTLLSPSVQAVHVPDYVPPRRGTSQYIQSSANVHLATPVLLRGTTFLKFCAPLQTQRSSDNSWRLTLLLELLMFSDFRPSVFNVLSDSCNAPMFKL